MKLSIKQKVLMEHLNYVIRGISSKNLIPILNCIKFELTNEGLYLLSTIVPAEKLRLLLQSSRALSRAASAIRASASLPNIRIRCLNDSIVWIRVTPSSPAEPVLAFLS